ncbi:MAG: hypothetical protein EOR78_29475 [Mesorhizobium sp.]|nr:MAG: hypothetical protein EOR78_29475 [Mesorhizobium sp.]
MARRPSVRIGHLKKSQHGLAEGIFCRAADGNDHSQTGDGVRYEEPKSGRARTVALSACTVAELKAHRGAACSPIRPGPR